MELGTKKEMNGGVIHYVDSQNRLHNPIGPAVIWPDFEGEPGQREWWIHGKRHRSGGKPAVQNYIGQYYAYYEDGLLHREGGPAEVSGSGYMVFYMRGKKHNPNGAASFISACAQVGENTSDSIFFYENGVEVEKKED